MSEEKSLELSEQTKRNIEKSRKQYKEGKFKTLEQIKKEITKFRLPSS